VLPEDEICAKIDFNARCLNMLAVTGNAGKTEGKMMKYSFCFWSFFIA